jgi:L-amino acid N-acyltransferase YncA
VQYSFQRMATCHGCAIIDILNHYVAHSFAAYPERPIPLEFFNRYLHATEGYPALVVFSKAEHLAGFGFLRPFHPASSLRRTAEVTYFILPEFTRQGIGTALLNRLIEQAVPMGIDSIVANISSRNPESIAFHKKNGFHECGRFERAGCKNGEDFDIVWMQKLL